MSSTTPLFPKSTELFDELWNELGGDADQLPAISFTGDGALPSKFALTDIAAAAHAACGAALSELVGQATGDRPSVAVDRRLASASFELPPRTFLAYGDAPLHHDSPWFGHYKTADDRSVWVQAGFPTLRARLLDALGIGEDPDAFATALRALPGEELESRAVEAGAVVALSRSAEEWQDHPQGRAVAAEPLIRAELTGTDARPDWRPTPGRPLAGIRVLDLTRVVAGPTGTRMLAAAGAEVMRIDAPGSDESVFMRGANADHNAGKRWAFLDLKSVEGRERFFELLATADVLAHSYRPGAIDSLVDPERRAKVRPGLIEVAIDAYGWTGPWRHRRGFDSIVQYSTGLADESTAWALEDPDRRIPMYSFGGAVPADRPRHMPVEALDLTTGYLLAASVFRGLTKRIVNGRGTTARLSLARTAKFVRSTRVDPAAPTLTPPVAFDYIDRVVTTNRGAGRQMPFPLRVDGNPLFWERPVELPGSSAPVWSIPIS